MRRTVEIARLGHKGDGIADTAGGPLAVAFALPGETVTLRERDGQGEADEILVASRDRASPVCRHFGTCGGCQLQHLRLEAYHEWKRGLVVAALARAGVKADVAPMRHFPIASRRRAIFTAIRAADGVRLGFSQRHSNRIVDLGECPVLLAEISGRLEELRRLAAILAPRKGVMKIAVLACDNGLDVAANNGGPTPEKARQAAIGWAQANAVARLSLNGETLIEAGRPLLSAGAAKVSPPADGFVQAVVGAEEAMAGLVIGHCADARRIADLFCGYGAFALRLAATAQVHAVERDGAALVVLERAWRECGGRLKAITTDRRDLFRAPLTATELKPFDAVVFDPPRAGAEGQARELAKSKVGRIAAVSCNPATLARDLRILTDGGYRVTTVTPIDQFAFSPHVEVVALAER